MFYNFCTFGFHKCFFWLWKSICLLLTGAFLFLAFVRFYTSYSEN